MLVRQVTAVGRHGQLKRPGPATKAVDGDLLDKRRIRLRIVGGTRGAFRRLGRSADELDRFRDSAGEVN
jgi:hypothetical protein